MGDRPMEILNYSIESIISFDEESIEKFLDLCESAIVNLTTDNHIQFKLKSILHELIINSVEHGYSKKSGKVSCNLRNTGESYIIEIIDEGSGIKGKHLKPDDLSQELSDLEHRGWGLTLINKLSFGKMNVSGNKPNGTKISVSIPK